MTASCRMSRSYLVKAMAIGNRGAEAPSFLREGVL